jgi:hypothetical protein
MLISQYFIQLPFSKNIGKIYIKKFTIFSSIFFVVLGIELMALHLLRECSNHLSTQDSGLPESCKNWNFTIKH